MARHWWMCKQHDIFVDRGDAAGFDFEVGDFTADNDWHDLDLSAIVPAGAKAVILYLSITDDIIGKNFRFRKKGNINAYNIGQVIHQVADTAITGTVIVALDENRVIQYNAGPGTWVSVNVYVNGWFN